MNTYQRLPVSFQRGNGAWLYDSDGKRYLDALCGIAVTGLGHCHPAVTEAIQKQAVDLLHTSNLYRIEAQEKLAQQLCRISGMEHCFFANSGAEANEAAIKLARLHAHQRRVAAPVIVTFDGSFHGRTLATLTATGNPAVKAGFEPLPAGFLQLPYDDIAAAQQLLGSRDDIAAVLIEVIQGESGVQPASAEYLQQLQALCQQHGALFMVDEVQTGNGRCGDYFAYQGLDLTPDVVTTAKGLGNGVPIGACIARGDAATTLAPGNHGSTFGGNPLACAAALAVIETIENEQLLARCTQLGEQMMADLAAQLGDTAGVEAIRGRGLMIGIALDRPCAELVARALEAGLLINVAGGNVVRLLPPLTLSDSEAAKIVGTVAEIITEFLAAP